MDAPHVHGVIRFDAVLERRREYVHDNFVTQNRRRVKDVWGTVRHGHCDPVDDRTADGHRSLPVGIDPLPGRVAVGGRLLVALEAVAYGRRCRPDPRPGVVFLPGLRLG